MLFGELHRSVDDELDDNAEVDGVDHGIIKLLSVYELIGVMMMMMKITIV